jgi:hypothetical protein
MCTGDYVCMMSYDGMTMNDIDVTGRPSPGVEKAKSAMLSTFVVRHTLPRVWSPVDREIKQFVKHH